jgi:hypothetical protein
MEVCRVAETAVTADEDQGVWTDYLADDFIAAYSVWDCDFYSYNRHYWG